MKYACTFAHPLTGEHRVVIVDVSDAELEAAASADDPEFYEHVFALVRGYREARGFAHTERPRKLS